MDALKEIRLIDTELRPSLLTLIADGMGVMIEDIFRHDRHAPVADARALLRWVLHRRLLGSLHRTGLLMGLSHGTVLHNARRVDDWLADPRTTDPRTAAVAAELDRLTQSLDRRRHYGFEDRQQPT